MGMSRMLKGTLAENLHRYSDTPREITRLHEDFLDFVIYFDHHDEFYTKTNLNTHTIDWSHGINTWLGYTDATKDTSLPFDYLTQFVHPFVRDWYRLIMNAAMLTMIKMKTVPLAYRFVLNIPFKKGDKYLLVKQMSMPFEHDSNKNAVTFLHSYTLVGEYRQEPMKLELFKAQEKLDLESQTSFNNYIAGCVKIPYKLKLSPTNHKIIKAVRYLQNSNLEVTNQALADIITGDRKSTVMPNTTGVFLKQLKKKLIDLMLEDATIPEEIFFSKETKHLTVFNYFEQSGILDFIAEL